MSLCPYKYLTPNILSVPAFSLSFCTTMYTVNQDMHVLLVCSSPLLPFIFMSPHIYVCIYITIADLSS